MNEKGILKSGNTTLEKRDSDAIFKKCISNICVVSRTFLLGLKRLYTFNRIIILK